MFGIHIGMLYNPIRKLHFYFVSRSVINSTSILPSFCCHKFSTNVLNNNNVQTETSDFALLWHWKSHIRGGCSQNIVEWLCLFSSSCKCAAFNIFVLLSFVRNARLPQHFTIITCKPHKMLPIYFTEIVQFNIKYISKTAHHFYTAAIYEPLFYHAQSGAYCAERLWR